MSLKLHKKSLLYFAGKNRGTNRKEITIPASEVSWSVKGLTPNTKYSLRISAVNALGESEAGNPVSVITEEEGNFIYSINFSL